MRLRLIFFSTFICLLLVSRSSAQNWQVGIFGGVNSYKGDIAPTVRITESRPMLGALVKRTVSPFFSFSLNAAYGRLQGSDANTEYLRPRNLSFETNIYRGEFLTEFNFFNFIKGLNPYRFTPYVYGGVGTIYFNPTAELDGVNYELLNFQTEQGKTTSNLAITIPFGGGFKYAIDQRTVISIFGGLTLTTSDYIDDVSGVYPSSFPDEIDAQLSDRSLDNYPKAARANRERGIYDNNDWIYSIGISLTHVFENSRCFDF